MERKSSSPSPPLNTSMSVSLSDLLALYTISGLLPFNAMAATKLIGPAWPSISASGAREPVTVLVVPMAGRGRRRITPALVPINRDDLTCASEEILKQDSLCWQRMGFRSVHINIYHIQEMSMTEVQTRQVLFPFSPIPNPFR